MRIDVDELRRRHTEIQARYPDEPRQKRPETRTIRLKVVDDPEAPGDLRPALDLNKRPKERPMPVQRWEHTFAVVQGWPASQEQAINALLTQHAADGWELVSHAVGADGSCSFTFKRPVADLEGPRR